MSALQAQVNILEFIIRIIFPIYARRTTCLCRALRSGKGIHFPGAWPQLGLRVLVGSLASLPHLHNNSPNLLISENLIYGSIFESN